MSNKKNEESSTSSWIFQKQHEWDSIKNQIDKSTVQVHDFLLSILAYASNLEELDQIDLCFSLFRTCQETLLQQDTYKMSEAEILGIGFDSYNEKKYLFAEYLFKYLSDIGDVSGKNNLAYMIRRKEVSQQSGYKLIDALKLLHPGVEINDPFSFVNTALTLALGFGTEEDWKLADEIMSCLPTGNLLNITEWWLGVAKNGEVEGVLVHYLLLRHKKIEQSDLGTLKFLSYKLCANISDFPEWLRSPI